MVVGGGWWVEGTRTVVNTTSADGRTDARQHTRFMKTTTAPLMPCQPSTVHTHTHTPPGLGSMREAAPLLPDDVEWILTSGLNEKSVRRIPVVDSLRWVD